MSEHLNGTGKDQGMPTLSKISNSSNLLLVAATTIVYCSRTHTVIQYLAEYIP